MSRHVENAVIVALLLVLVGVGLFAEAGRERPVTTAQEGPVCPARSYR